MASYPTNIVVFTTHVNLTEVIDASHPNNIQAEVVAIESTLGTNPHVSTTPSSGGTFTGNSTTFANINARLANIETGIVSDSHTHYVHKAGGDTIAPAAGTRGLTIQAPTGQTVDTLRVLSHDGVTNLIQVTSSEAVVLHQPTVSDFTNAAHTHSAAISGGQLTQANTHGSPDTDVATTSLHHTIGTGSNQAAPGTHPGATSGTHGVTGSFVGTTDVQTLSGKTLTAPVIATITNVGTITLPTSTDTLVGRNTADTLTNKTLTTPVIGSFANAQHDHASAAGGAQLTQGNTHGSADTDASTFSIHHTIGGGAAQAAAGNHNHAGVYANSSHGHAEGDVSGLTADLGNRVVGTGSFVAGVTAATTNASGIATIGHGLGHTPSAVVCQYETSSGSKRDLHLSNKTATTFDVTLYDPSAGTVVTGAGFTLSWMAWG